LDKFFDWKRAKLLFDNKDYIFALFCLHLSIEKLCKVLWVRVIYSRKRPKKMSTKEGAINYIKNYLKAAKRNNIRIEKAVLFGSYAKSSQRKESDIDLALISNQFTDNPLQNRALLSPLSFRFHRIEPHPFSASYFKTGDPFIDEIKSTGIEVSID
jgi:AbiV family abortive infection protein